MRSYKLFTLKKKILATFSIRVKSVPPKKKSVMNKLI